jgi:phytoene synthase
MMTLVMGERAAAVLARACDLGAAMQLTNIARDVGEDARRGRLYLPTDWLAEAGIDPEAFLAAPRFDARLGLVVARLLGSAGALYARADAGIAALPRDCRAAIRGAGLVYADIGRVVASRGYDSVTSRAVVSTPRKLWLLFRAFTHRDRAAAAGALPALGPCAFLVEAGGAPLGGAAPA